jgi:single-strand DNA-binding protein
MANEPTITIVGHVGGEPSVRLTNDGIAVCTFSVANTERKMINGQWQDVGTTWFRVTTWKEQAEIHADLLKTGDKVIVVGRFRISEYEKDGEKRTTPEINAEHVGVILKRETPKQQTTNRDPF